MSKALVDLTKSGSCYYRIQCELEFTFKNLLQYYEGLLKPDGNKLMNLFAQIVI